MTERRKKFLIFAFFTAWVVYFGIFWSKALFFDEFGNLVAGHVNIWGDWAAHMTMGNAMAVRGPLLQESPLLINQPFAYPFVSNMISAILQIAGVSLIYSYTLPSYVFSLLVVAAVFWFFAVFFKSRGVALLATMLFLFNGGVGFMYFLQDIAVSERPVHTLLNPPHEYTRYDEKGLKWISVIDSMIIPQRAFALGFPIALIGLTLLTQNRTTSTKKPTWQAELKLGFATTLIGLLPILHTHSFLAVFIILVCWSSTELLQVWCDTKSWPEVKKILFYWLKIAAMVSLVALPLILLFFSKNVSGDSGFGRWHPGWLASDFKENWFVFWLKNWGAVPIIATISWCILWQRWTTTSREIARKIIPFFLLFVMANLWLFQPHVWDNTKLLVWTSIGFSGLAGLFLFRSWRYLNSAKISLVTKTITKISLVVLFILMTASGAVDAYYDVRHDLHSYVMFSSAEIKLANWAKENTSVESIWLTGDQHNHWLYVLTGRQAIMTYRGWQWTHGYNYRPAEADVSKMFTEPKKNLALFEKYNVDYIVVGPNERSVWKANEGEISRQFKKVIQTTDFAIFEVTKQ